VYKYHIFLIHSSVVGDLGCFHNLAIVNRVSHCSKRSIRECVSRGGGGVIESLEPGLKRRERGERNIVWQQLQVGKTKRVEEMD
jgi:hypothetical protein